MSTFKKLFFATMTVCLVAVPAFSQTPAVQKTTTQKVATQAKQAKSVAKKQVEFPSAKLIQQLELSSDQVKTIKAERQKEIDAIKAEAKKATPDKRKAIMSKMKAATEKVLVANLTEEQKTKYNKLKAAVRKKGKAKISK